MNIGFVTDAVIKNMAGTGRYAKNVFCALKQKGHVPVPIDWRERGTVACALGSDVSRIITVANPWPVRKSLLWHFFLLQALGNKTEDVDIVFSPSQFVNPLTRLTVPFVYVVHDVSFMTVPECHKRGKKTVFQLFFSKTLHNADRIVCVSEYTQEQLRKYFPVDKKKLAVIPEGVEEQFRPGMHPETLDEVRQKYGLPKAFLLYVGTVEPRKNLERLFHAYSRFSVNIGIPLYIAGSIGWRTKGILELHRRLSLHESVKFLGYVPDEDLPALYNAATAFVYVSKDEGFGLPPLEAMSCGTPVLISDAESLREIAGDAALVASAADVDAIGEGLVKIAGDAGLRSDLAKKGLQRAQAYTWDKTARRLLSLFQELIP